jgi:sulfur-oxidizing protein SoxY
MRLALAVALLTAFPAMAEMTPAWDDLRPVIYGQADMQSGDGVILLDVPYRTMSDSRTAFGVALTAPEGQRIESLAIILDDNPMPLSAELDLSAPQQSLSFRTFLRINGPTPYHVVARMDGGQIYVTEGFLKTSGEGACSAPPVTNTELALSTLGDMEIAVGRESASAAGLLSALAGGQTDLTIDISHPSLSGMQRDQISLLFIPARYVRTLEIAVDGAPYATLTGSISLSENPQVILSIPGAAHSVDVTMTDTDGTVGHTGRSLAAY